MELATRFVRAYTHDSVGITIVFRANSRAHRRGSAVALARPNLSTVAREDSVARSAGARPDAYRTVRVLYVLQAEF